MSHPLRSAAPSSRPALNLPGRVRHAGRHVGLFAQSFWWWLHRRFVRPQAGQTTAEYALVLLGVAAIAILLLTWARRTDTIDRLLDAVLESLIGEVE